MTIDELSETKVAYCGRGSLNTHEASYIRPLHRQDPFHSAFGNFIRVIWRSRYRMPLCTACPYSRCSNILKTTWFFHGSQFCVYQCSTIVEQVGTPCVSQLTRYYYEGRDRRNSSKVCLSCLRR